jgi:hypothetical protein
MVVLDRVADLGEQRSDPDDVGAQLALRSFDPAHDALLHHNGG